MKQVTVLAVSTGCMSSFSPAPVTEAQAVVSCPITYPQGGIYGNESLQAVLPKGGTFVFAPGGAGFTDRDGALGIKFGWERLIKGNLYVGGRRLDGEAAPARAYIPDGYGDIGFQPIYLVFPTPGCWEIFGVVSNATLTFVLLVERIGEGPSWRFRGLERGWRQTTGCSEPVVDKVPPSNCPRPVAEPGS